MVGATLQRQSSFDSFPCSLTVVRFSSFYASTPLFGTQWMAYSVISGRDYFGQSAL